MVAVVAVLGAAGFGVSRALQGQKSAEAEAAEAVAEARCEPGDVAPLAADLDAVQARLVAAEARADSLSRVIAARQDTEASDQGEAADLAKTLATMEGDALEAVVQRLDGRSFVRLYEATSSRNRSRLLSALTPAQAAAFLRHQLPGGAAARPAPPDTAASPS